ncbi:hypothetical protein ACHQM5_004352 [Ranunculus cassubicifolius]
MLDTNLFPSSQSQTENPNGDLENESHHPSPSSSSQASQSELKLSSDVLAKGVSSILGTVMRDFDLKSENTINSQDQLEVSINRLTGELDQLLEDAPLPFIMQHAAKISGVRKRVSSLNALLKSIQRRIDNIDRMISTGSSHGMHHSYCI